MEEDNTHGWQKVTYAKKQRKNLNKKAQSDNSRALPDGSGFPPQSNTVFHGLEKHAEERRGKLNAQRVYDDEDEIPLRSKNNREEEDGFSSEADAKNNAVDENKKEKPKKVKKPKVTVAEAAAKIDADDLAAFLSSISESYEVRFQLMRFADYFGRAFSAVSSSQFPWLKLFRESTVAKIADVPVSYISEAVYKTSVDWISHQSNDALRTFAVWSLDFILADLASQQLGSKGSKKGAQPASSKSQVAIFLTLAMVLRRKPDVLYTLPKLGEDSKYQGQDKLPVIVWMVVQACQGDLAVGLHSWAHHVFPILGGKLGSNPQTRDLVLQLVERILAAPKARGILVSNAVRKGERLLPPAALDLLLRVTFPVASGRVKATERFEAIYPVLKKVALASVGSKVALQIQAFTVKAAGEGIPALSEEAISIFIWSLSQNPYCYKQWEKVYSDNIEFSAATLRKVVENWIQFESTPHFLQELEDTLQSFRQKNKRALSGELDRTHQSYFKDADKHCKTILGRLPSIPSVLKIAVFGVTAIVVFTALLSSPHWYSSGANPHIDSSSLIRKCNDCCCCQSC